MPDETDVVIIGNGVAGYAAADRLARHGTRCVLIGPGPVADRPPLTKAALLAGEPILLGTPEKMAERGIKHLQGWAEEADLHERRVVVTHGDDQIAVRAEFVVLAVGLQYQPPPISGLELAEVNATPEGMVSLHRRLAPWDRSARRVVIVGAGLIGTETAATLSGAGHAVTVIDLEPRPLHRLHDPVPELAAAALNRAGVRFMGGVRLQAVEHNVDGTVLVLGSGGERLHADVVIAATGGRHRALPGLPDQIGPIAVGPGMRVPGYDRVFAVGDCVAPLHDRFGRLNFPHWDTAIGTGSLAADAILGGEGAYTRLPSWWTDIGTSRIAEVGVAAAACEWALEDGLHVGRDATGEAVCVMVVDQPRRMRDARALLAVMV